MNVSGDGSIRQENPLGRPWSRTLSTSRATTTGYTPLTGRAAKSSRSQYPGSVPVRPWRWAMACYCYLARMGSCTPFAEKNGASVAILPQCQMEYPTYPPSYY